MPVTVAPLTRRVAVPTAALALLAVLAIAFVAGGPSAVAGVAIGVAIVVAFFLTGRIPVFLGPDIPRGPAFLLLSLGYLLRVLLLLVAFQVLAGADWLERRALGATLIAGALLWSAAQLRAHLRRRTPDRADDRTSDRPYPGPDPGSGNRPRGGRTEPPSSQPPPGRAGEAVGR